VATILFVVAKNSERDAILRDIEALEGRFRFELDRHNANLAAMRGELHRIVERGDQLGVSVTAMAKAMKISRGRLTRMLDQLR
jgi:hypothetical protein